MKLLIGIIIGAIAILCGLFYFFGDDIIPSIEPISVDYCLEQNHSVEQRDVADDIIKVCNFENGGWCEVNEYYEGMCGES